MPLIMPRGFLGPDRHWTLPSSLDTDADAAVLDVVRNVGQLGQPTGSPDLCLGHRRLEEVGEDAQADVNVLLIRSLENRYEETDEVLVEKVLDA